MTPNTFCRGKKSPYIKCATYQEKKTEVCYEQGSSLISVNKYNSMPLETDHIPQPKDNKNEKKELK